jgi:hypothetical protein
MLEIYRKQMQEKCNRRLRKVKGTVCQLYSNGFSQEVDDILDKCMQTYDEEENEGSSTSSEE